MLEKNLDYLKSNIRNHGFGETLGPELEAQLQKGLSEFTLAYKTEFNKREIEATLYFRKSESTDMYFFNKYDTRLKTEKDETLSQTFYINKGWGITLKEAYNLLNGRAVHKELTDKQDQKYQAWVQLDFSAQDKNGNYERKQYHENYGYDLKEALSYYFIREMANAKDTEALIRSLERGNLQMVNVKTEAGDVKVYIEANPQYKSINVYDNNLHRLNQDQRQELMQKPALTENPSLVKEKDIKQTLAREDKDGKKQERGMKAKSSAEEKGLVQKKRSSGNKKGLGV